MFSLRVVLLLLSICDYLNAQYPYRPWWEPQIHYRHPYPFLTPDFALPPTPRPNLEPSPKFTVVAPEPLRVGSKENILVEAFNLPEPTKVSLTIYDYPAKAIQLWQGIVTLSVTNGYSALRGVEINPSLLRPEEKFAKSVHLVTQFGLAHKIEQTLKVSFLSGYIFIQTDKPIYNPGDTVRYRAFVSNVEFQAFNSTISVEIQNSDEITVYAEGKTRAENGIFSHTYTLSDMAKEGKWKIIAKFDHWKENTFSAEFEVKKYVLPAFNVTLTPVKYHLDVEYEEFSVKVSARYLYGEQVEGVAYVVFGVETNGNKIRLPYMKQVKDLKEGKATLTMEELKKVYPDIKVLVGSFLYVKASVMTKTGSDLVEAEKSGIKIIKTAFELSFKGTSKFFKPGLPFDVTLAVSHHDGSPALNVPVKLNLLASPVTTNSDTIKVSLNMPSLLQSQLIIAETRMPGLKDDQQARKMLTVYPYQPYNPRRQNYLYISVSSSSMKVGDVLNMKLYISLFSEIERSFIKHLSYIIMNKGKISHAGKIHVVGQDITNFALLITPDLMPSFRFLAYYVLPWQTGAEVVADSLLVDVKGQCVGSLTVGPVSGEESMSDSYSPGTSFRFQVRGDPGSKVSLVAVDNAIFLLSKGRLTQTKIWETVGRSDKGCSSGGGRTSMLMFEEAGLSFRSNYATVTTSSFEPLCRDNPRKRRSAEQMRIRTELEKKFSTDLEHRCCMDGIKEIRMPYSCRRRSFYITEDWSCVVAFLQCCSQYWGEPLGVITPPPTTTAEPPTPSPTLLIVSGEFMIPLFHSPSRIDLHRFTMEREIAQIERDVGIPGPPGYPEYARIPEHPASAGIPGRHGPPGVPGPLGRPGLQGSVLAREIPTMSQMPEEEIDEHEYESADDIYVRTKFFESWLWTDIKLPEVTDLSAKDGLVAVPVYSPLPDSITQWGILGISASADTGFCVAEPFNIRVWKPFYIDLRLPRTVARHEHVEVKAVLHNYMNEDLQVLVILEKTQDMCSVAFTGDYKKQVSVGARSSVLLPYTVIPLKAGEFPLQITATARFFSGQDAIKKTLHVVVEGIQRMDVKSYVLRPLGEGHDGKQQIHVEKAKLLSVVPNSIPETFVNVRGNVLADSIDNSINKDSLAALIQMPGGCVEQNLARVALPIIATYYLDRSDQWELVGLKRREEAIGYIQKGYEKQLHYRKNDESYPPYRNEGTSTWITAFVVKVFAMAKPYIGVDEQHICGPLIHLLKHKQLNSGAFKEDNPASDTFITGGLRGAESKETLTAFVLIALAEAQAAVSCSDGSINPQESFRRAGNYLKERFRQLRRPYSVAIACYALAVSGQGCMKSVLLQAASPDRTHWRESGNSFVTLESTGYALLALLKGGHLVEAAAPFNWLNEQRRPGGGFGSTQSTVVVLQALSEYLVKVPPRSALNLQVELQVPGRSDMRWAFTPRLAHVARSSRVPLDQDFMVVASGTGQGILEVVTVYNELPDVYEKSTCNGFELDVSISESSEKPPPDVEKSFNLNISVRALGPRQVRMVILDISLPTGFEPETSDLELMTNSVDRYINFFQVVDNLSDRGSLIIHLFKVSHRETDLITFRLQQKFKVGLLQPSTVTVYQYYNKDKSCTRFYTPPEDKEQLGQICKNICRCTQGDCCVMKTDDQSFSVSDRRKIACGGIYHVFKVKVLSVNISQYDRYEMEITQVIKEGSEVGLKLQDTRVFLSHSSCKAGLNLQEGQDYLIIGPPSDIWHEGSSYTGYTYTLGKTTWLERWPSSAECLTQTAIFKRCQDLDSFADELLKKGCPT
ncbi:venom factor-like isoform X1 [Hoplias malabaricus]|uniref:venom factor-like isoform X1 n=1 Tax=Hoplias malabaricus TaxID=27720 RepID=UPI0034620CDF